MKNKKGFSLVELIVSFVIISILSIAIFRTVLSLESKQLRNIAYNSYLSFQVALNNPIQTDFTTKIIEAVEFCGRNCYKIKYVGEVPKELSINENDRTFKYGNIVEKLPSSFSFYRDIEVTEDEFDNTNEGEYNSILTVRIPISSNVLAGNLDLIYAYQYDNRTQPIKSIAEIDYTNYIVRDLSGNGYDGVLKNGASFKDGGLLLTGDDDYVQLPTLPSTINWRDGITIEFSAKWDVNQKWSRIFDFGNGSATNNIAVSNQETTTNVRLTLYYEGISTGYNVATTSNTRSNYRIVISKSGSNYVLTSYKDGVQTFTETFAMKNFLANQTRTSNYIGKSNWADSYFNGVIYNLKITQANGTKIIDFDFTNEQNYIAP
jgi:prepilin-type N-terminal cleavage/methylation domain-containing protein